MPRLTAIVPATNGPRTLARCKAAILGSSDPPEELIVVDAPSSVGPAAARNTGADRAAGDVLVFVDADVIVHPDAFGHIRSAFARDPELTAVFGSYDDAPEAQGFVSLFRNLLPHHVHQRASGPATTFWSGLGAIRRDRFLAVGGFDANRLSAPFVEQLDRSLRAIDGQAGDAYRFSAPFVEDVDLGMRLSDAGDRIAIDPQILGKHLKAWTLVGMIRTDLTRRGIPWISLLLRRRRSSAALNLGWSHRLSAAASLGAVASLAARRPSGALVALAGLAGLNSSFYRLFWRRGGAPAVIGAAGLHVLHHVTSAAAVPLGLAAYALERPRPLPDTPKGSLRTSRIVVRATALRRRGAHDRGSAPASPAGVV
jgi:hypothetical protein